MQSQLLSDWPKFPFCSQKCKTIDLGRWLSESYSIPAEGAEDAEEEVEQP
jgi:endogenous inhibitor of DNA gyrase (YacG/DUF329 family)